jgi:DNA-binding PadR family transcriptional regulator
VAARGLRNPISLVVLGLLAEQPLHPYGMRLLMRERGHDRKVKARPASLYDAVERLDAAGMIEVQESARAGRRPERTVYRLTAAGGAALQEWVRDGLLELDAPERFMVALSFMFALPKSEVIARLRRRTAALDELIETAERGIADAADSGVPDIFLSEEQYSQALRHAEHDWLTHFTGQLQSGALRWPSRSRHGARKTEPLTDSGSASRTGGRSSTTR